MSYEEELKVVEQASAGTIAHVQRVALRIYGRYDLKESLLWLSEEVGELIASIRKGRSPEDVKGELADVFAWVLCLCNILGHDAAEVVRQAFQKEAARQLRQYGRLKYWDQGG
jgi:NTP pyrophosphatase (non-canonical NTP hydrolase)